jgi:hypothetical protein
LPQQDVFYKRKLKVIMKKSIITLLLFFAGLTQMNAQANWKDSIAGYKPDSVNVSDDFIAFRVNKKWGLYFIAQKYVEVKPTFDLIIYNSALHRNAFFGMKENKIGFYGVNGEMLTETSEAKLMLMKFDMGENTFSYLQKGNQGYRPIWNEDYLDTIEISKDGPYNEFQVKGAYGIERTGNFLIVNMFYMYFPMPYQRYIEDAGVFIDSTDFSGNPVYPETEPLQESGVYDLSKGKWVVKNAYRVMK